MSRLMQQNICHALAVEDWSRLPTLTFRLQVSVYEPHQVQVLERSSHFSCIESCGILIDALVRPCLQSSEELSSAAVLHTQVKMVLGLERVIQRHDERMVASRKDFLLGESTLDLVALDHLLLRQDCRS